MRKKGIMLILGIILLMCIPVGAATVTTSDGVLSIETSSDLWKQKNDADTWFALTDGKNTLEIDHLSKGEELQSVKYPTDDQGVLYQAFITTNNEVFALNASAASKTDLGEVIKMIGTIRILKFDTKTAVQGKTQNVSASGFDIRKMNARYTVNVDELNLRSSYDTNSSVIDVLYEGDQVLVTGAVTKDGADYGWYQVQYNGETAYVSSSFLSPDPAGSSSDSSASAAAGSEDRHATGEGFPVIDGSGNYVGILVPYSNGVYYTEGEMAPYYPDGDGNYYGGIGEGRTVYQAEPCPYCGEYYPAGGGNLRTHVLVAHPDEYFGDFTHITEEDSLLMCEYCGEWFEAGDEYRNHVMEVHLNNEESLENASDDSEELIRCEYCHLYFRAEDYNDHVATHLDGSYEEESGFQCPLCGEWVHEGAENLEHLSTMHPEVLEEGDKYVYSD